MSEQTVEDERLFNAEIARIDSETKAAKLDAEVNFYAEKERLRQADLEAQAQANETLKQGLFQAFQAISDARFAAEQEAIQRSQQEQLKDLNKRKDQELSNKRLTDKQKLEIEERYRKEEAAIKLQAWEAEQDAKLAQAIINTALAVTAALATGPPQGYALAAVSAALGAIEIATIASQKPPQFALGTEFVKGPGTETSDSIPAFLSKGERVFSAKKNRDYWPILSAIHNDRIAPELANSLVDISAVGPGMKDLDAAFSASFMGRDIDYNKIGRSIADHLYSDLEELTGAVKESGEIQAKLLYSLNKSLQKRSTGSFRQR